MDVSHVLVVVAPGGVPRELVEDLAFNNVVVEHLSEPMQALVQLDRRRDYLALVADLDLPGMSGIELLRLARSRHPQVVPILSYSGADLDFVLRVVNDHHFSYIVRGIERDGELRRVLDRVRAQAADGARRGEVTIAVARRIEELHRQATALRLSLRDQQRLLSEKLAGVLGLRDSETASHCRRVAAYAAVLGRELGMARERLEGFELGALLHDVGKMRVPDRILFKPGPLTAEEWSVVKRHPGYGVELIAGFDFGRPALLVIEEHHERYDGRGYPRGLEGEAISLEGRVFAIVDAFDAITSDRPFAARRDLDTALRLLAEGRGQQFDPGLVDLFLSVPRATWRSLQRANADSMPELRALWRRCHTLNDGDRLAGEGAAPGGASSGKFF